MDQPITPRNRGLRSSVNKCSISSSSEDLSMLEELKKLNAEKKLEKEASNQQKYTIPEFTINLTQPEPACLSFQETTTTRTTSFYNQNYLCPDICSGIESSTSSSSQTSIEQNETPKSRDTSFNYLHKQVKGVLEQEGYTVDEPDYHSDSHLKLLKDHQEEIVNKASQEYKRSEQYVPYSLSFSCIEISPERPRRKLRSQKSQTLQTKKSQFRRSLTNEEFEDPVPKKMVVPELNLKTIVSAGHMEDIESPTMEGSKSLRLSSFNNLKEEKSQNLAQQVSDTRTPNIDLSMHYSGEWNKINMSEPTSEASQITNLSKRRNIPTLTCIEKPSKFFQENQMRGDIDNDESDISQCSPVDIRSRMLDVSLNYISESLSASPMTNSRNYNSYQPKSFSISLNEVAKTTNYQESSNSFTSFTTGRMESSLADIQMSPCPSGISPLSIALFSPTTPSSYLSCVSPLALNNVQSPYIQSLLAQGQSTPRNEIQISPIKSNPVSKIPDYVPYSRALLSNLCN